MLAASNSQAQDLDRMVRSGQPRPVNILNRRWIAARNGDIYHYDLFEVQTGQLVGFWKYEFNQKTRRLSRITYAERIRFDRPSATPDSPVGAWKTGPGWVRESGATPKPPTRPSPPGR